MAAKYDIIDKFGVMEMEKAEFKKMWDYVQKNCQCQKGCPTYVQGDAPVGYCYPPIGTSKKIQWEKNCICETCPVWKEFELDHTFYCTRCSQVCQSMKTDVFAGHE